jgi:hypothetical protein
VFKVVQLLIVIIRHFNYKHTIIALKVKVVINLLELDLEVYNRVKSLLQEPISAFIFNINLVLDLIKGKIVFILNDTLFDLNHHLFLHSLPDDRGPAATSDRTRLSNKGNPIPILLLLTSFDMLLKSLFHENGLAEFTLQAH